MASKRKPTGVSGPSSVKRWPVAFTRASLRRFTLANRVLLAMAFLPTGDLGWTWR